MLIEVRRVTLYLGGRVHGFARAAVEDPSRISEGADVEASEGHKDDKDEAAPSEAQDGSSVPPPTKRRCGRPRAEGPSRRDQARKQYLLHKLLNIAEDFRARCIQGLKFCAFLEK